MFQGSAPGVTGRQSRVLNSGTVPPTAQSLPSPSAHSTCCHLTLNSNHQGYMALQQLIRQVRDLSLDQAIGEPRHPSTRLVGMLHLLSSF